MGMEIDFPAILPYNSPAPIAGSSNGRTPDSGSGNLGSSPSPAAKPTCEPLKNTKRDPLFFLSRLDIEISQNR